MRVAACCDLRVNPSIAYLARSESCVWSVPYAWLPLATFSISLSHAGLFSTLRATNARAKRLKDPGLRVCTETMDVISLFHPLG